MGIEQNILDMVEIRNKTLCDTKLRVNCTIAKNEFPKLYKTKKIANVYITKSIDENNLVQTFTYSFELNVSGKWALWWYLFGVLEGINIEEMFKKLEDKKNGIPMQSSS